MRIFLSVLLACFLYPSARAGILFVGVICESSQTRIALEDSDSGSAKWVDIGGVFLGYQVVEISAPFEVVKLKRDGVILQVRLQGSKIENLDDGDPSTRESRFKAEVLKLVLRNFNDKRLSFSLDELIQLGVRFGRIVLRREAKDDQDMLVIGVPGLKVDIDEKNVMKITLPSKPGVRGFTVLIR